MKCGADTPVRVRDGIVHTFRYLFRVLVKARST
jgi:hypothetical protein